MHRSSTAAVLFASLGLAAAASAGQAPLFLSTADNVGNGVPGFGPFTDEDVISTSLDGATASLAFGIASGDLDAAHRLPNGNWLVSSLFNGSFGGTSFDDGDVVEIDIAAGVVVSTAISTTIFESSADISAVTVLPNGNFALSTIGDTSIDGVGFERGDLVEYDPNTGVASVIIAGADLFDDADGNIYGAHAFADGTFLLTANTDEVINGETFRDGDAFLYDPATDTATLVFSEDTFTDEFSSVNSYDIDALFFAGPIPTPGGVALAGLSLLALGQRRRA